MPSYEHKKLIEKISEIDKMPEDKSEYAQWIKATAHLELLRANAGEDEIIVYAGGDYTFIQSVVVSRKAIYPLDQDDLLLWSGNIYSGCACYEWGGGRDDVWIDRTAPIYGTKSLSACRAIVFARTIDGLQDKNSSYFELSQEYAHITNIHWREAHRAYCRFDRHGEWEHVVSITSGETCHDVSLVSFKRKPLEEYLAASDSILVRMFDFTLLNRKDFREWSDGPEDVVKKKTLFYRQKIDSGKAAYTTGVQVVEPKRGKAEIFAAIKDDTVPADDSYVEFIARDWRNKCIALISTSPNATTSYFQASHNDLPFELSPAFFRPEVLLRYKGDSDKYNIEERDIICRGGWRLRGYDVNEAGQVHAYICDLSKLPYEEQLYWKSFNEKPKGGISERAFINDFEGEVADVSDPLLQIKLVLRQWEDRKVTWWRLPDHRLADRVNTPRTSSRDEWGTAFKDLSKLVIESLHTGGIREELGRRNIEWTKNDKSLALIERIVDRRLDSLRLVQRIRSKVDAHIGGDEAESLSTEALQKHGSYASHFNHVCRQVIDELKLIEQAFSG